MSNVDDHGRSRRCPARPARSGPRWTLSVCKTQPRGRVALPPGLKARLPRWRRVVPARLTDTPPREHAITVRNYPGSDRPRTGARPAPQPNTLADDTVQVPRGPPQSPGPGWGASRPWQCWPGAHAIGQPANRPPRSPALPGASSGPADVALETGPGFQVHPCPEGNGTAATGNLISSRPTPRAEGQQRAAGRPKSQPGIRGRHAPARPVPAHGIGSPLIRHNSPGAESGAATAARYEQTRPLCCAGPGRPPPVNRGPG